MTFEKIIEVVENISCPPYEVAVDKFDGNPAIVALLRVWAVLPDSETGQRSAQQGRQWAIGRDMSADDIARTALRAVLDFVEHETRESFKYMGMPIFGPHFDVSLLAAALAHQPQWVTAGQHAPPPRATSTPLNAEAADYDPTLDDVEGVQLGHVDSRCTRCGRMHFTGDCTKSANYERTHFTGMPEQVPPGDPRLTV